MEPQALIIGGGVTGTGLARDLALRGVSCLLVEKRDINAGASGGNHGLLHSGARYVSTDPASAIACREEAEVLRSIAPHCLEETGGLFVAVPGDDENYIAEFPHLCASSGISCHPLSPSEAREAEPSLSREIIAAFAVDDATINPFQISLDNVSQAVGLGAVYLGNHEVLDFTRGPEGIEEVVIRNALSGGEKRLRPAIVINATGAWASRLAALAGVDIPMHINKGSLAVLHNRLTHMVVNRLRPPDDGDILVPGGNVSILGTTSVPIEDPDAIRPSVQEVDLLVDEGSAMIPSLETARYIRAYAGVRPLLGSGDASSDDRSASRGFNLFDHAEQGLNNFITITGGKLTTFRLMAEKAADLASSKLGLSEPCRTHSHLFASSPAGQWTEPTRSSAHWLRSSSADDLLLCECEMIPKSHFTQVLDCLEEGWPSDLNAIKLRTRMGKGACQGAFCSLRLTGAMYDDGRLDGDSGLRQIKDFMRSRWIGQRPILWDGQLVQAELTEAIHCSLLGFDRLEPESGSTAF